MECLLGVLHVGGCKDESCSRPTLRATLGRSSGRLWRTVRHMIPVRDTSVAVSDR